MLLQSLKKSLVIFSASLSNIDKSEALIVKAVDALLITEIDRFICLGSKTLEVPCIVSATPVNPVPAPKQPVIVNQHQRTANTFITSSPR